MYRLSKISALLLFFLINNAFCQKDFRIKVSSRDMHLYDLMEFSQDTYLFCGAIPKESNWQKPDSALLIKWSTDGDSVTTTFKIPNKESCTFKKIRKNKADQIIAFGVAKHHNTIDTGDFFAVAYDTSLNMLWQSSLTIPRTDISVQDVEGLPNGNWLVGMDCGNRNWLPDSVPVSQIYMIEIDNQGNIEHVVEDTVGCIWDMAIHPDSARIFLFGQFRFLMHNGHDCAVIFDTAYNKLSLKPIIPDVGYGHYRQVLWLNADTLLLSAANSMPYYDTDITLNKMVDSDSLITCQSKRFRYSNVNDNPFGLVKTRSGRLIQIGTLAEFSWPLGWIGEYDEQLNLIDHRIFDIPHRVTSFEQLKLKSTLDSGFIAFMLSSSAPNTFSDSLYIIKFGSDFNLSDIEKIESSNNGGVFTFPNPGNERMNICIPEKVRKENDCTLQLFTQDGKLIFSKEIYDEISSVETKQLPNGVYFYRVMLGNTVYSTGKWIK